MNSYTYKIQIEDDWFKHWKGKCKLINVIDLYETDKKGIYVTENNSDVYSTRRNTIHKLKPCNNGNGYLYIKDTNDKNIYIHRLKANAFLGLDLKDRHIQVNHLDGSPRNNARYNLTLCDNRENLRHAKRLAIMRKACKGRHISSKSINS